MQPKVDDSRKAKRALTLAQDIVRDIETKAHVAGDRLAREDEMLARYDVARATLREALRFLELQGVIHLQLGRGGGPVVARPQTGDFANNLSLILQFMEADLRGLLELREAIAPNVAAYAAQRATTGDLSALADCLKELERNEVSSQFEELNRRFHDMLGWASGNPLFGLLTSALHMLTREFSLSLGYSAQERAVQLRFLRRVLEAVRKGDAEGARQAMARLVAGSASYLAERSPELVSQKVKWGQT
ncbi:MAG TPA: FCD domain-containing protein [Hyphomonas sp.]|jgi:DNA-binding FadR family transcriptional regulator|uniref:FadR/GntR family transcriptional regulator n=1 Tax=Hyphomonas sp. TaxID=87 RepID=UPI0005F0DE86|nr:FCD domain-containing protein [Hyphomonas sp.]KJS26448.1 MAG: GntR family transcriptional regulator [Hyphomonadaceae bacterium BRH_c29]MBU4062311.1 FCD domain-containing protein [Alphaproteobacteria bacterium]MBA3066988.1 FadR family transcriptional regulator [Hyphomonas sp.]MBU4163181.1 FCD domain-containing protein [Alphaproteobacteria bacterium]MDP3458338.1 FCD domain-containing protein [Hyphomonas sp.]